MKSRFPIKPSKCPSTHGGAGYAPMTTINKKGQAVCGLCGTVCSIIPTRSNSFMLHELPLPTDKKWYQFWK